MLHTSFAFDYLVLLIILGCTISQVIFGVGILLWGTPLLLIYGLDYITTLSIVLPLSLIISIIQVLPNFRCVKKENIYKFLIFSVPTLFLGLSVHLYFQLDVKYFVATALILGGVLRLPKSKSLQTFIGRAKNLLLPLLGFVHGVSNLGGSILILWSAFATSTKLENRTTVAVAYVFLATLQIITVAISQFEFTIYLSYIVLTVPFYLLLSDRVFNALNEKYFQGLLTFLIFTVAILMYV